MRLTPLRLAMWSGPRNISTALMRAWENRADCIVWDEPFYGYYLDATGIDHPGASEIIAAQGTDAEAIIAACTGDIPQGKAIFYQKHMTLHLLPQLDRGWLAALDNCFLIREPEAVIASYAAVRDKPTLDDIGFVQQAELFDEVQRMSGHQPLVIDSREFLLDPAPDAAGNLRPFRSRIQRRHAALARRIAGTVTASGRLTGTTRSGSPPASRPTANGNTQLGEHEQKIAELARPYYEKLYRLRLRTG